MNIYSDSLGHSDVCIQCDKNSFCVERYNCPILLKAKQTSERRKSYSFINYMPVFLGFR